MYAIHRLLIPKSYLPYSLAPVKNGMIVDTGFRSYGKTPNAVMLDLIRHLLENYLTEHPPQSDERQSLDTYRYDLGEEIVKVASMINEVDLVTVALLDKGNEAIIDKALSVLKNRSLLTAASRPLHGDKSVLIADTIKEIGRLIDQLFSEDGICRQDEIACRLANVTNELSSYY